MRAAAPTVSILCVTHNRRELLLECLASCRQQDYPPVELIVVDNASDDGTDEALRERFPEALLIRTHRNLGFFPALNLAIANARGDYLMTVDDDARFLHSDAVRRMVDAFRHEPDLGAVTCNIEGPRESPPAARDRYVHTFKTGFTMVPRQAFDTWVGYYPDVFFRSAGEQYLATALWNAGRPVKQLAGVRMHHALAMQGRSLWAWGFYGLRSQILVCMMRDPWYLVPPRLGAKFVNSLVHGIRKRDLRAWAAGWTNVWWHLPEALRLRRPIRWSTQRLLWRLRRDHVSARPVD